MLKWKYMTIPRIDTIEAVLNTLGWRIVIEPISDNGLREMVVRPYNGARQIVAPMHKRA